MKQKNGGIFSAVMQYGSNFLAVGGFSFLGGNDFGESGKPKHGGIVSAVVQYGGNCLAVMFWRQAVFRFSAVT